MKKLKIKRVELAKIFQKTGKVTYGFIFAVLVLVAVVIAISTFKIPGNYMLLIVESGSMEPAIKAGSVVITKPQADYQINDIVTVLEPANPRVMLTHRIVEIEKAGKDTAYVTKGDANNGNDAKKRVKPYVVGKVLFSVPFIGYLVDFIKTKNGLLVLIIIPSVLIIYNEAMNIKKETINIIKKRRYV